MGRKLLGPGFGPIGSVLLLRFLLDGLLQLVQNVELLELRVTGHRLLKFKNG